MREILLSVEHLVTEFETREGPLRAVDDVSFTVARGSTLGIVGESGSGKSVTALSILRLLPGNSARIRSGRILFQGQDLLMMPERVLRRIRGRDISMVFQDPAAYLNPTLTIGSQLREAISAHRRDLSRQAVEARAIELLTLVGIASPGRAIRLYPHEFSGGMRQRVMIAMAISNEPKLILADEPTTALDVTIQAQVVEVLKNVQEQTGAALILITHDLGLASELVDEVIVMYGGRIAERAPMRAIMTDPRHPYTVGLISSLPRLDVVLSRLPAIPGQPIVRVGDLRGCVFASRCGLGQGRTRCEQETPPLREIDRGRYAACHYSEEVPLWRPASPVVKKTVSSDTSRDPGRLAR